MAAKKAAQDAVDDAPAPKKSKKKIIILAIVLLVLLGGGVYMAWYLLMAPEGTSMFGLFGGAKTEETNAAAPQQPADPTAKGPVLSMTPFLVNLADPLGRRYIKLSMDVEVRDNGDVQTLTEAMPRARDSILMLLSSKTFEDISSTEGKILLKTEIANRINQILGGPKVIQIYFTDLVIQ